MSEHVLNVEGLNKTYKTDFWQKDAKILHDVSFFVPENSICGLVGPNGAGKTTIIKSLFDFVHPESGKIRFFGKSIHDAGIKSRIGYLPEQAYYYEYLTGAEFLNFYAKLFDFPKGQKQKCIESLLEQVGLSHAATRKLRNYSKGMLQRIGIAQSLINDPSFVILDEPMTGLDPIGRKDIRDIILNLKEAGKTVLVCSHILSDIEYLCDRVVLIVGGRVKAFGDIKEVITPEVHRIDYFFQSARTPEIPKAWLQKVELKVFPNKQILHVLDPKTISQKDVLSWLESFEIEVESIVPHKESLEDLMVASLKEAL